MAKMKTTTPTPYPPELAAIIAAFDKTLNDMDHQLEKAAQIFSKNKKSVFFKREALLKSLKNKGLNVYYDAAMDAIYIVDFDALLLSEDFECKSYKQTETPFVKSIREGIRPDILKIKNFRELESLNYQP
jgi:hypothetical protein